MKPISISLTPNTEKDDIRLALGLILQPWKWKKGRAIGDFENQLRGYLGVRFAVSFNSGRSALMAILRSFNLPADSEVLLQSFTCVAAVSPIIWEGLKPIYVDCDKESFNMDLVDLRAKISPRTRVLMVQHTFGLPCDMEAVLGIAKQSNLIVIEDCAHALDASYNGQKVGTFGKASFFSFSRDKIISSVYGGMAVTDDEEIGRRLKELQKDFGYPSFFWIFQQLLHPLLMNFVILPVYNFLDLGKIFLVLSQWFGILSKAVHWKEKIGKRPSYFPERLPYALAALAQNQFKKLDRFYNHRREIVDLYFKELQNTAFELPKEFPGRKNSFLRFTIKHPKAHEIIYEAWHKQNILVGDWYMKPVVPIDTDLESIGYKIGCCPNAEKLAKITLNLPTHINISVQDARKIINFLKEYEHHNKRDRK
ncbi:MAG: DegT/DnrJ/EryC1/StrS family aminotransferase [Candidatus Staskawiczbacteria bacterium]|jgi:dTDP-4-amino-4,6-dideoxygalactose transaminase